MQYLRNMAYGMILDLAGHCLAIGCKKYKMKML